MPKFEFPLGRAMRWYQQKLAVEQAALQTTLAEIDRMDCEMQALHTRKTAEQDQMQAAGSFHGSDLQTLAYYGTQIRNEIERLRPLRARLKGRIEEQRLRVLALDRKSRMLENLEARRRTEWLQELDREENALASDLFLSKLVREADPADPAA